MSTPRRASRSLLVLLGAFALIAAACTDDGDEGATTTAPTTTESTEDGPDPVDDTEVAGTLERYEGRTSEVYADLANWVCHPDDDTDMCADGLDATVVDADGTLTEEPWEAAEDPGADCFYVYPTISRDPEPISDRDHSDEEEGFVTLNQAARLGEACRVFAPVYRQRTLAGLTSALGGGEPDTTMPDGTEIDPDTGYNDVVEAWEHYMATENQGRPVVLIGHSQGAGVLNRLIRERVDPHDDVRSLLLSAFVAGATVRVPEGEDVGGDFEQVPLCRASDQTGCVVSWAAYAADEPPPEGALFGRPRSGDGVAACNSPASLAGGAADARSYFPASGGASILSSLGTDAEGRSWVDPEFGEITTPFVTTPGLVTVECVSRDGFDYLEVTVNADPDGPRADEIGGEISPEWGLHLQDVNVVMGDVVELVRSQLAAFPNP